MSLQSVIEPVAATVQPLLEVEGLSVAFGDGAVVVRDLGFRLDPGRTLAVVGESGSGKSVTSLALMGLLGPEGGRVTTGTMRFAAAEGPVDLARLDEPALRRLRGAEIAMIFQEPMTALNPVFTVGDQIVETILQHRAIGRRAARAEAVELLAKVRLPDPAQMFSRYPHQLSGGQRQRVVIAMALCCRPRLLIADEPTTALDVTVQAQILDLIRDLQAETGVGVIFITHDMGVVAEMADEVLVMHRGARVESGPVDRVFAVPSVAYTRMLLDAVPRPGGLADQDLPLRLPVTMLGEAGVVRIGARAVQDTVVAGRPILELDHVSARFDVGFDLFGRATHRVHAAESVSLALNRGETLALVGESGSGKSTLGRIAQGLVRPVEGRVHVDGRVVAEMSAAERLVVSRRVHTVYQDPMASLNPRRSVGDSIAEPMIIHGLLPDPGARASRVGALLAAVGLQPGDAARFPHQFSGGQRQRICIARALAAEAEVIIADEAVSALDASVRAQVVRLLMDLQAERGLACLFISHDFGVVEQMAHRIAVVYMGQIVEIGPRRAVIGNPQHSYTRRLLDAVPRPEPGRRRPPLTLGEVPSPVRRTGEEVARVALLRVGPDHWAARE